MTSLYARGLYIDGRLKLTSLAADGGSLIALVGPNGGGKTSLLRAIAGVENAAGIVTIDGEDVSRAPLARRRRLLSFLPASRDVRWPIAVRDVIALGSEQLSDDRVDQLIDMFELQALADRPIDRLSTGERARALTARALASEPRVLLLDEPLSNLDPYWVLRFLDILRNASDNGQCVIVALHDLEMMPRFDRAIMLADGSIQMDETPASLIASERFGSIFGIAPDSRGGWKIRPPEDRQSSP
jgi:iron complex transport system ATP-binding protein